jgi:hypothetical protein
MGKLSIATKLSDELGIALTKARKFVDDIGGSKAQKALDELGSAGSRAVGDYLKPATVLVGGAGGGYLVWRQQTVAQARALSEQASSYNDAVQAIAESDLPPDVKEALVDDATDAANRRNSNDDDGSSSSFLDQIFNDPMKMVFALVIVVVVLQMALDDTAGSMMALPGGAA